MEKRNVFSMSRDSFESAVTNLETIQRQNEKLLQLFLHQPDQGGPKLNKDCIEWVSDTRKALSDFRDLIMKGLDYLDVNLEKIDREPYRQEG